MAKGIQSEKKWSTNGAATTGFLHAKGFSWTPASRHMQKLTQNRSMTTRELKP